MSSQPMASAVNYPYPFEVNVASYVQVKLDHTNYSLWKKLMLNLITSHQLVGFVDGTIEPPPLPSPEEEQNQEQHRLWMRSDGLVKGWIFATVTEEILLKKVRLKTAGEHEEVLSSPHESGEILPELVSLTTAREVWIALQNIPARSIFAPSKSESSFKAEFEDERPARSRYLPLYRAIRNGDWENATKFLEQEPNAVCEAITVFSETALMLAIGSSKRNHFVKKLMERMSPEDVARTDNFGLTALSKAVINGNNVAAKWLVKKNPELLNIKDRELGRDTRLLAVHYAAMRGNREMVDYLLKFTKLDGDPNPFEGQLGVQLLKTLVYGEHYDIASTFLQHYPKLASIHINGDTPLKEISYRLASFRSRTRLNFVQRLIYSGIPLKLEGNANQPVGRDIENSADGIVSPMVSQKLHAMFWDVAEKLVPTINSVRETKLKHHRALEFVKDFCQEVVKSELSNVDVIFQGPLLNAATLGICEIVEEILDLYPSGIYFENQREQSFFQLAIENRHENVFNLIYQMDGNQDYFLATVDKFGNNALHTIGKFTSWQQLSLQTNVAGAALQIQRELQWFKVVENLLHPLDRYARNKDNKIAQDIFTETHKDLVKEGEKWMKDTASSCTIVAALIVTVVFAAAITVPGGSNNDNGLPTYLDDRVFFLFGVFDALALFSSTASLLMFLSIFTSRYGERDFLYSLPRKLIIGMVTLFLSIISMMIAFGATLKIVFGYKRAWVVIPIVVLSSMPITLFALLQFPLLLDMIRSTYYSGIFKKRSNRILS